MSKNPDDPPKPTASQVGYGHPPIHSRFKPGESGNPSGRPKRRQSFILDLIEVLDALEPGGDKKTNQRRIVENLVNDARQRKPLAIKMVVPLAVSFDNNTKPEDPGELTELQRKLVDDFERRQASADSTTPPSRDGSKDHGGSHE